MWHLEHNQTNKEENIFNLERHFISIHALCLPPYQKHFISLYLRDTFTDNPANQKKRKSSLKIQLFDSKIRKESKAQLQLIATLSTKKKGNFKLYFLGLKFDQLSLKESTGYRDKKRN